MDEISLQALRTIDKFDKIRRDGVVDLLQKPLPEGAGLNEIQAALIGQYLEVGGKSNEETLSNMTKWFSHAAKVRSRLSLMCLLEETDIGGGKTAWDRLIEMPTNSDETWRGGRRPENIGWALDDMVEMFTTKDSANDDK